MVDKSGTNPNDCPPTVESTVAVPKEIGRFKIKKLAAQGGMARIYLASDPVLQRDVALKIPLPEMLELDSTIGERFRREGQAVALLSHPAIVPVFDAGEVNGQPFIAFQWIDGLNLQQYLKQQLKDGQSKLTTRESGFAISRLASAVAHAHAKGILHRDIKPANVLIDSTADSLPWYEQLRITDFGLAKVFVEDNTILTTNESIIGTPAYMSPEAVNGSVDVDPTSIHWEYSCMSC